MVLGQLAERRTVARNYLPSLSPKGKRMSAASLVKAEFKRAVASADPLIRLRHPSGLYLNINGTGLTPERHPGRCYAARAEQVANMRRVNPLAAECREVGA